jgi:hypothetical protein
MFCVEPGSNLATRNWKWAMNFCIDRGQALVRIETEAENEFLYEQLDAMDGSGAVWMAATDQDDEDVWLWAEDANGDTGEQFFDGGDNDPIGDSFVDWNSGEPDNAPGAIGGADCGAFEDLGDQGWGWADRSCSASYDRLVCEATD